ncbi:MAG: hypothetical protein ACYCSN_14700 [Acidobacteriaceae bacterium]
MLVSEEVRVKRGNYLENVKWYMAGFVGMATLIVAAYFAAEVLARRAESRAVEVHERSQSLIAELEERRDG